VSYVPYLECLSSMIPTHVSVAIGFVGGEEKGVEDGGIKQSKGCLGLVCFTTVPFSDDRAVNGVLHFTTLPINLCLRVFACLLYFKLSKNVRRTGQKSREYSAFGQITGLCPCKLQALCATRLAGQPAVQGVIPIFIVGLSMNALF
jgi:hypothetical protein